jgi:hypothetical protein
MTEKTATKSLTGGAREVVTHSSGFERAQRHLDSPSTLVEPHTQGHRASAP